jgi:hypothetical protein
MMIVDTDCRQRLSECFVSEKIQYNVGFDIYGIFWPDNNRMEFPVGPAKFMLCFLCVDDGNQGRLG